MIQEIDVEWSTIRKTLAACLDMLDRRDEPLIAIYVATALERMEARQQEADGTLA